MKRLVNQFKTSLCLLLVFIFTLGVAACIEGCARKPTTNALNASKVTHVGVTTGIRAWNTTVAARDAEIKVLEKSTNAAVLKGAEKRREALVKESRQVIESYRTYQAANKASMLIARELVDVPVDGTNGPAIQDQLDKSREKVKESLVDVGKVLAERNIDVK